ncbi:hypothetical protein M2454_000520 [Aequitasia blattaphilus]|uniref:Uncharacterized protein n=1 Tax=Aequitasia blattaphilus TaxID=2949332 RepID=A0ABT1E897_9FIRM|nr:hypothetical protein [Aequitasia blattaphilus]MCP1101091.1 hypothetical protein [Aequitasia blattaphilus]MCR8613731.1 hypothetical protein [Aequitasia blattaphilus]
MKDKKGQPGYIQDKKRKYLIYTIAEFSVVIILLVMGIVATKTRLNLLTVAAVVGCLPASKMLVALIVMMPHKSVAKEIVQDVANKGDLLLSVYDLILTSKDDIMPVDIIVISDHTICGYTSSQKVKEDVVAQHIKQLLAEQKIEKVTVKIFKDYKAFLSRVEGLNAMRSVDKKKCTKEEQRMKGIILTSAM